MLKRNDILPTNPLDAQKFEPPILRLETGEPILKLFVPDPQNATMEITEPIASTFLRNGVTWNIDDQTAR